jgi:hypothetical protein
VFLIDLSLYVIKYFLFMNEDEEIISLLWLM